MMSIRSSSYAVVTICGLLVASVPIVAIADVQVTSKVLVDGKPLATGKITFYQRDGQFVGGPVKNGAGKGAGNGDILRFRTHPGEQDN